ncbi:hypothetical protein, partial [uncultured Chryseobacterium sp.]|uniref:hypothetical protein n=1 Tax=uncultured Chryseobacterium sp. TaxID=259322 RepID=UPI0025CFA0EE
AFKSAFNSDDVSYARLNDGTHSYNYETTRFGLMGMLGLSSPYYTPVENLKYYYFNTYFLADCIDLYADTCSQVNIVEVDAKGNEMPESPYLDFLQEPNAYQGKQEFISEMVINTLTSGISVQYGNFFKNGNLKAGAQLFNIDFGRISFPKIKNPYLLSKKDIQELTVKETLDEGLIRNIKLFELAYFYDRIGKKGFDKAGYNSKNFFNPASRLFPLLSSLHTLMNSQDTMAYLSSNPVNSIISKDNPPAGSVTRLPEDQKNDVEVKLNGKGRYGAGSGKIGDLIYSDEALKRLDLTRDSRKMQPIEMQGNAKDNVRNRFLIPRDYFDDSTYENKQFSEARFTLGAAKMLTDNFLNTLTLRSPEYFKSRGTKLMGKYDHMPSIIEAKKSLENKGLLDRAKATTEVLKAFEVMKQIEPTIKWDDFLIRHQFSEYFKTAV